jgi:hypothetical protein
MFHALRITPYDLSRYNCRTLSFSNKYNEGIQIILLSSENSNLN